MGGDDAKARKQHANHHAIERRCSMSKAEQYVQKLKKCQQMDTEEGHCEADRILLDIIRNELGEEYKQVIEEYEWVPKWYA